MKLLSEHGYHGHCKNHSNINLPTFRLHSKTSAMRFCKFCNKETLILPCDCKVRECKENKRRRREEAKHNRRR